MTGYIEDCLAIPIYTGILARRALPSRLIIP